MQKKYFGTDGIRGRVGVAPITAEFVLKLGWAAGKVLVESKPGLVIIGKDTRSSGYMFESALQAGLNAAGVNVALTGPLPTPAIAHLTRAFRAQAGFVISASHNPYFDNGIKIFSTAGKKLSDATEASIESLIQQPLTTNAAGDIGKTVRIVGAIERYVEFCKSSIPYDIQFKQLRIVVDCANGANYLVAPTVYRELGADVIVVNNQPNGVNINSDSGSTHPNGLQAAVLANGADIGIAFDGDGDRVILVDHLGNIVDGDDILYIIARAYLFQGRHLGSVVGTVMTNRGLEIALDEIGVSLIRAAVGDRNVLEAMEQHKALIGGESSGHVICLDKTVTGDGVITSLQVLHAMSLLEKRLADLKRMVRTFPQILVNIPADSGTDITEQPRLKIAVDQARARLGRNGRILIRRSGTEPVIRLLVEGEDSAVVQTQAAALRRILEAQARDAELVT